MNSISSTRFSLLRSVSMRRLFARCWFAAVLCSTLLAIGCPAQIGPPALKCTTPTDCDDGLVCQRGDCVARCTDGSCTDGVCDVAAGTCVECLTSEQCGDGRVCNAFSGTCVVETPACTNDNQCGALLCDAIKGVCVECNVDGDCFGGRCDQGSQTCTAVTTCTDDTDCAGQACNPITGTCVECLSDADCAPGTCDTASNTCAVGCIDNDATEPNEGAQAVLLSGDHEGRICGTDTDEFIVTVASANSDLAATVFVEGGAALELHLEDNAGATVSTANATADGLALSATGVGAGTYRLVLFGADGAVSADYLLRLAIDAPASCQDVEQEPNDSNATALAVPTDGNLRAGSLCPHGVDDVDVWTFNAAAGDDVNVDVVAGNGAGALAITLVSSSGASLGSGSTIAAPNVQAGSYFVRVTSTVAGAYSLRVTAAAEPPVCMQADAEPNDTVAAAQLLTPGMLVTGTICAGDLDQWRFAANSLDDVTVTLSGSTITARLVRASDGVVLQSGTSLSVANVAAGGYRVEVQGNNAAATTSYTLNVALVAEPVPDPCLEGGVEPDDTNPRALAVDATVLAGRICVNDSDMFAMDLPFASTLTVTTRFTDADGDIDIELLDGAGVVLQRSAGVSDSEVLTRALQPGSYRLRVFGFAGAINTYTVEATLQGCTPDDGFEDNSAFARATPLGPSSVNAVRCPGDDDFYLVALQNGDAVDVGLTLPSNSGTTMSLVSLGGALLQPDSAVAGGRRLQTTGLAAGKYLVRVTGTTAQRVPYTMNTAITPNPARCVDDGASPNETAAEAFVVDASGLADGSYQFGALIACQSQDADWFAIDLPGDRQVAITLTFPNDRDLDAELLEPRGTSGFTRSLARSLATDAQDRLSGVMNVSERAFVRMVSFSSTPVQYGIGIEVLPLPNLPCVDDRFDSWLASGSGGTNLERDNNTPSAAVITSLPESFINQHICADDVDWHKFTLTAGQQVTVALTYSHSVGHDVDMRAFGPASQTTPLATCTRASNQTGSALACSSAGFDGTEDLVFTADVAGDHFVQIVGFNHGENSYTLSVSSP